jgi:hypothetical protein
MIETPTRERIMALLSPPSQDVHLTVEDARWIAAEIRQYREALEKINGDDFGLTDLRRIARYALSDSGKRDIGKEILDSVEALDGR